MEQKPKKPKKKSGSLWWIAVLLLMGSLSEIGEKIDFRGLRRGRLPLRYWFFRMGIDPDWGIPLLFTVLTVAVILIIVSVAKRKAAEKADRPAPAAKHRDPRTESFTKPDAHCVSCELSGDDHFERDKQQRIRQLDEWLKNGIIDRAEYRRLKQHYQQDP